MTSEYIFFKQNMLIRLKMIMTRLSLIFTPSQLLLNMAASLKFLSAIPSSECFIFIRNANCINRSIKSKPLRSFSSCKNFFTEKICTRKLIVASSVGFAGVTFAVLKSWAPVWPTLAAESRQKPDVKPSKSVRINFFESCVHFTPQFLILNLCHG